MKRILLHIPILLFVLVSACHTEQVEFSHALSSTYPILSRGGTEEASLANGSQILLNASGGLSVENGIFTYNGSSWSNGQELHWTDESMETTITALYPTYTDNRYTSENLYAKGMLEDILIAQETLQEKGEINLQFKHLFSSLTLFIEPTLDANIQELALSVPVQVEAVSASDGTFSLTDQTHTVVQSRNDSHAYSFILPPCDDCTLSLRITWKDGIFKDVPFSPHNFQSGTRYECNITSTDSRPGIRTADDLIDFSRLINGYEPITAGRTLDEFGEEIDGKMIYYLWKNIELTEADCTDLYPIGYKKAKAFANIFDGKGHTISGYIIPDKGFDSDCIGLFGIIDEGAIVKNLHLSGIKNTDATIYECVGGIAGKNSGIIQNCSVQDSKLYSSGVVSNFTGGICGSSSGFIINCYVTNNTYYRRTGNITGDILGDGSGTIINCYSHKNKHSTQINKNAYSGSIAGRSPNGQISNCYVYKESETPPNNWGALLGFYDGYNPTLIESFFYNIENTHGNNHDHNNPEGSQIYDDAFKVNNVHISTLLNQWIDTTGKESYSNFTFRRWKVSTDGSACFQ
ncbi:MAG: fimbrillin family protein [Bacteroides sp.]|nr:fimbrillin family protein [Bacteroides sp.]